MMRKMIVPKDILNLVKNFRYLFVYFKDFILKYCYKNDNRGADVIGKKTYI